MNNESTHYNIYSDKNPTEQSLIYDIRRMQQMLYEKDLRKYHLVDTKDQLADLFTKCTKPSGSFTRAVFDGFLDQQCKCCYKKNQFNLTGVVEHDDYRGDEYETGPESQSQTESEEEGPQVNG